MWMQHNTCTGTLKICKAHRCSVSKEKRRKKIPQIKETSFFKKKWFSYKIKNKEEC